MNKTDLSAFAMRLRSLRKAVNLRQEDVADALNLSRTAYTKYENDGARPDQERLPTLAELFHVSVDYLLGKDAETPENSLEDNGTIPLTDEEMELVTSFRRLTESQKQLILQNEHELLGIPHEEE